ncbi:fungal-specific transcription factor domain-containing protein [Lentinula edodes]|nr:fungal-specific transcription factor domain-containing protein [Lentinula edodes]
MANVAPVGGFKKRRLANACDICKAKKIRCDSAKMPGNVCSNCRAFGSECTHSLSTAKKPYNLTKIYKDSDTEDGHEFAKAQISDILSTLAAYELPDDSDKILKILIEIASYARSLEIKLEKQSNSSVYPLHSVPSTHVEQDYLHVEMEVSDTIIRLERLGVQDSFFGKDSQLALVKAAMSVRNEYTSEERTLGSKRPEFWEVFPWQELHDTTSYDLPPLVFPDPDLLSHLVDFYFDKRNTFMPLLHRATFDNGLRNGLHNVDRDFGELVLSVCALGARYSDDLRVYADVKTKHSLGWPYFSQIVVLQDLTRTSALYRVQIIVVHCSYDRAGVQNAVMFLQSTSMPGLCWPILGLGVRFAQIVGAHRRNFFGPTPTIAGELWKRAFWCLVCIDTFMSSFLGRPKATNPADYDLDFPVDCDDEYWLQPGEQAFQQPTGKPSTVSSWIHFLKLLDIFGLAQRSIYAVRKPEQWASNASWDENIVAELDVALNKWADTVLIQIHRPFIFVPGKGKGSGMKYSSLAICANAARSCVHVFGRLHSRDCEHGYPSTHVALFNSAIVLLLNLWGGRQLGLATDPIRTMADVNKSLRILKTYESIMLDECGMLIPPLLHFIWQKLTFDGSDIISELISASNAASPPATVEQISRTSKRRQRENDPSDGEHPSSSALGDHFSTMVDLPSITSITGSSYSSSMSYSSGIPASAREIPLGSEALVPEATLNVTPDLDFSEGLPLRTEDLGKLPVHFLPSSYANSEAQAPAYPMPVLSEGFQYSGFDSQPNDPLGSTGIPFGIDNSFWGPGTAPAHAALAMFNNTPGGDHRSKARKESSTAGEGAQSQLEMPASSSDNPMTGSQAVERKA